jgi:hypothetical protein
MLEERALYLLIRQGIESRGALKIDRSILRVVEARDQKRDRARVTKITQSFHRRPMEKMVRIREIGSGLVENLHPVRFHRRSNGDDERIAH